MNEGKFINSYISIYITGMLCGGVTVFWAEPMVSRPFIWLNAHLGCHMDVRIWYIYIYIYKEPKLWIVSSSGLVVKHPALGVKGHRFKPSKRSKPFQGLISWLITSGVVDHIKWCYRFHWSIKNKGWRKRSHEDVKHPEGFLAPSFHIAPLWVVREEFLNQHRGCAE